jgi:hypothetical protein
MAGGRLHLVMVGGLKRNQRSENRAVRAHDLATDDLERDQAAGEQAIMEIGQRKVIAYLRSVIVAQFQDFELAERVVDVARIARAPIGFTASLGLRRSAFLREYLYGVIDALAFGVHFDRRDEAAITQQRSLYLADLQFRVTITRPCSTIICSA